MIKNRKEQLYLQLHPRNRRIFSSIGENIALARRKRKISIKSMAERTAMSTQTIVRAEKGDPTISLVVLANILQALNLGNDMEAIANPLTDKIGQQIDKEKYLRYRLNNDNFKDFNP